MRYRIIKESNMNDETFFEVHFYKQVKSLFFFKKWKWEPVVEYKRAGDFYQFARTARFDTLEEAQKTVNKYATKRLLMSAGEVNTDEEFTCS